jgi:undecaprenyl-diphosphatase
MCAASGYSLLKASGGMSGTQWIALAIGFAVSFAVALAVIAFLMKFIQRHNLRAFAWYRVALAAVIAFMIGEWGV